MPDGHVEVWTWNRLWTLIEGMKTIGTEWERKRKDDDEERLHND